MHRALILWLLACLVVSPGCRKQPAPAPPAPEPPALEPAPPPPLRLLRIHFAGALQIAQDPESAKLKEIWALPQTSELLMQTLDKLAGVITRDDEPDESAKLLRPLLDDLLQHESWLELRRHPDQSLEFAFASRLPAERHGQWSTNLWQGLSGRLHAEPIELSGSGGWELRQPDAQRTWRFQSAGEWALLAAGPEALPLLAEFNTGIGQQGAPVQADPTNWLELEVTLEAWAAVRKSSAPDQLPRLFVNVSAKDQYLRTQGRAVYAEPLTLDLAPWLIPTNSIHDPLISFTALQGIRSRFENDPRLKPLAIDDPPNQLFLWAQSQVPFQSYAAARLPDPTNQIERLAPVIMSQMNTNLLQHALGQIRFHTNRTELMWQGLPIIIPFVRPAGEADSEFAVGGLFPTAPIPSPMPEELIAQLAGRTNQVYYDWEITEARLMQWQQLLQLLSLLSPQPALQPNSPGQKWLQAIAPQLGNTVTEVTLTSPTEVTFIRRSHLGFTGIELNLLARWLDSPDFPFWKGWKSLGGQPAVVPAPPAP